MIISCPSKYGNKKIQSADGVFDSKLEYTRWQQLKILERAKVIKDLQRQVKFVLIDKSPYGREISYIADFCYKKDQKLVVEDTKSDATKTPLYRLKKRLFSERYKMEILEIKRTDI